MKPGILLIIIFTAISVTGQVKILFDATKAETVANADWQIDADKFNLQFIAGLPSLSNFIYEANPQRYPNPPAEFVTASTPENYWMGALSSWAIECVKYGYKVETLPALGSRITYGDPTNEQDLKNYRIFVLCEPNIRFTESESQAIKEFVAKGGSLFMVCNHFGSDRNNDGYDSPVIFNEMMGVEKPFGFTFDSTSIWVSSNNALNIPDDPIIHGPFGVVDSVILSAGTTIRLFPENNNRVQGKFFLGWQPQLNTNAIVVTSRYGYGKVAAIGDSSIPDDGTGDVNDNLYNGWTGDGNGSHRRLVMNATVWLATADYPDLALPHEVTDVSCHGGNDGKINLSPTGGNGEYTFLWSSGQSSEDLESGIAGTYVVTVTSGGKTITDTFTISQPPMINALITVSPVTCINPGMILSNVTGGVPPYRYQWSSGASLSILTTPAAGSYTVTITDSKGCTFIESKELAADLQEPDFWIDGDLFITCSADSARFTAMSDTLTTEVLWQSQGFESHSRHISTVQTGTYTLTVTSLTNGCKSTQQVTVSEDKKLPALALTSQDTISCNVPFIHAEALTDADSIIWIQNSAIVSQDTAVTTQIPGLLIAVALNTLNGCTVSDSIFITEDLERPEIEIDTIINDTDYKSTGSARVKPAVTESHYTYDWKNSLQETISVTPEILNVPSGEYTCHVTANNGCDTLIFLNIENTSHTLEVKHTGLLLYPNPASETVQITWPGKAIAEVRLINITGQPVLKTLPSPENRIDLGSLLPGIYSIEVHSSTGVVRSVLLVSK